MAKILRKKDERYVDKFYHGVKFASNDLENIRTILFLQVVSLSYSNTTIAIKIKPFSMINFSLIK